MNTISINGRKIGPGHPPYIIAEISGNHNHDFERLIKLIDVAKEAGADAVKLQTYTADSLTIDSQDEDFILKGGTWDGWNLYKLYQQAHTPWEWHEKAFAHGHRIGIDVFSSPFDKKAVDLLSSLDAPVFKIASNEAADWPLVEYVAKQGKPLIISTGTSTKSDVRDTLGFLERKGISRGQIIILHCVSQYPAAPEDAKLDTIKDIEKEFGVLAGFSDHTLGTEVAAAAIAMGACVIEKHITLDRSDGGPDSSFSLEPEELANLCRDCRMAFEKNLDEQSVPAVLRGVQYGGDTDLGKKNIFQRCLWTVKDIKAGEVLGWDNIKSIRAPKSRGIRTRFYEDVIGKPALSDIKQYQPVNWEHIKQENSKSA